MFLYLEVLHNTHMHEHAHMCTHPHTCARVYIHPARLQSDESIQERGKPVGKGALSKNRGVWRGGSWLFLQRPLPLFLGESSSACSHPTRREFCLLLGLPQPSRPLGVPLPLLLLSLTHVPMDSSEPPQGVLPPLLAPQREAQSSTQPGTPSTGPEVGISPHGLSQVRQSRVLDTKCSESGAKRLESTWYDMTLSLSVYSGLSFTICQMGPGNDS